MIETKIDMNKLNLDQQVRYYERILCQLQNEVVYGKISPGNMKKQIYLLEKIQSYEDCLLKCEEYLAKYSQDAFVIGKMGMCCLKLSDFDKAQNLFAISEELYKQEKNQFMAFYYKKIIEKLRNKIENEEKENKVIEL